jgi:hypothetical protein
MRLLSPALGSGLINLDHPGHYLVFGVVQLSWANAIMLAVLATLFVLALLLPFPGGRR